MAADAEALAHYEQAMMAYARAFGDQWDPLQQAALERKIGETLFRRGEHAQGLDRLQRALATLGESLPTSRWGVRLAIVCEIVRQVGHRLFPGLFLKPASGPPPPTLEEVIHLYELIMWMEMFMNPERFLLASIRLLNVSERSGVSYGAAFGSTGLGLVMDYIPIFWLAESYHRRAVALAEQAQRPDTLSVTYIGMGAHKVWYLGELDVAIEYYRQAAAICQETGDLHSWGSATNMLAVALNYQGNFRQALTHCRDNVHLGQDGADAQVQLWGLSTQGFSLRRLGQFDEAIAVLRECVELAERAPDHAIYVSASGELGRCYLCQGELEQALSMLHAGQQICVEHGIGWGNEAPLCNGLAEAYLMAAEQSDTLQQSEKADWLKKAKRACQVALKHGRAFRSALPEAMMLQGRYEWLRDKPKAAQKWWQRSLELAEKQGQRYDLGMTHLEMGQRLGERAHLERAEAIFTEIGAEWDLARARELLERGG